MQPMFTKTNFLKNQTGMGMGEVERGGGTPTLEPPVHCTIYWYYVLVSKYQQEEKGRGASNAADQWNKLGKNIFNG